MRRSMVALALAGLLLAIGAGPAHAAPGPIEAGFPDIEVPVGGTSIDLLGPVLWSTAGPATFTGAKVTYKLTGPAGVRITPSDVGGGQCEAPSRTRVVCTDPRVLSFEGETIEQYLPVEVHASGRAKPGTRGKVTITFSADGVQPITGVSEVRVIDGETTLPVTGPTAALLGTAGLLLLGAGTAGLLAARRRTARFVA